MKVYKCTLMFTGRQGLNLPRGAEILSVQNQHEKIVMWAKVAPEAEKVPRTIYIVATGQEIPDDCRHIGTVQMRGGGFMAHVFMDCAA